MMYYVEYSEKESMVAEYGEMKTTKVSKEELVEMLQSPKVFVITARAEG